MAELGWLTEICDDIPAEESKLASVLVPLKEDDKPLVTCEETEFGAVVSEVEVPPIYPVPVIEFEADISEPGLPLLGPLAEAEFEATAPGLEAPPLGPLAGAEFGTDVSELGLRLFDSLVRAEIGANVPELDSVAETVFEADMLGEGLPLLRTLVEAAGLVE